MIKKFLFLFFCIITVGLQAQSFQIDGATYSVLPGTPNRVSLTQSNNLQTDVVLPSSVENEGITYAVAEIGSFAFSYNYGLSSVIIPNSVTKINNSAFYGCQSLYSVNIPDSVTSIGANCFKDCNGLYTATLPGSLTEIAAGLFQNCSQLQNITIPNSVTVIRSNAFDNCNALQSVTFPSSLQSIESFAFYYCLSLSSISIPNGTTAIGSSAFAQCVQIQNATLPNSVTVISDSAFLDCQSLSTLNYPTSLTTIGDNAFLNCINLTNGILPNSITYIGVAAFRGCQSLSSIEMGDAVTFVGSNAFNACFSATTLKLSKSLTTILPFAFANCFSLTSPIVIPTGVTQIRTYAFGGCEQITKLILPSSITLIAANAFIDCYNLTEVTARFTSLPSTNPDAFANIPLYGATLYVRPSMVNTFQSANPWYQFGSIIGKSTWELNQAGVAAWSDGVPDIDSVVEIATNYNESTDLQASRLQVTSNAVVTIPSGYDVTVLGDLTVAETASITFSNNANLIMISDPPLPSYDAIITSKRNAFMRRQDYVYWSSPVYGQTLLNFSPLTLPNRFYGFSEYSDAFYQVTNPQTEYFAIGSGYMVRAPNTFLNPPAAAQLFTGSFTGYPNNGTVSITTSKNTQGYHLLGNPYPSPISIDVFFNWNVGTIYFWTHQTQGAVAANYASCNEFGCVAATAGGEVPNGTIQTGQGFLLKVPFSTFATFNNSMRVGNNEGQFFRSANNENRHRLWLNLAAENEPLNQILIGYDTEATNGFDASKDGPLNNNGSSISSIIDAEKYAIQARTLPFEVTDVVPLHFTAQQAGSYSLSIDHAEGAFAEGQVVFIKDNILNVMHNLSESAYAFLSEIGDFNTRFELRFQAENLSTTEVFSNESVLVKKSENLLKVQSELHEITTVEIFDIQGRLIDKKRGLNAREVTFSLSNITQVLLVKVTSNTGAIATKKMIW